MKSKQAGVYTVSLLNNLVSVTDADGVGEGMWYPDNLVAERNYDLIVTEEDAVQFTEDICSVRNT